MCIHPHARAIQWITARVKAAKSHRFTGSGKLSSCLPHHSIAIKMPDFLMLQEKINVD